MQDGLLAIGGNNEDVSNKEGISSVIVIDAQRTSTAGQHPAIDGRNYGVREDVKLPTDYVNRQLEGNKEGIRYDNYQQKINDKYTALAAAKETYYETNKLGDGFTVMRYYLDIVDVYFDENKLEEGMLVYDEAFEFESQLPLSSGEYEYISNSYNSRIDRLVHTDIESVRIIINSQKVPLKMRSYIRQWAESVYAGEL